MSTAQTMTTDSGSKKRKLVNYDEALLFSYRLCEHCLDTTDAHWSVVDGVTFLTFFDRREFGMYNVEDTEKNIATLMNWAGLNAAVVCMTKFRVDARFTTPDVIDRIYTDMTLTELE